MLPDVCESTRSWFVEKMSPACKLVTASHDAYLSNYVMTTNIITLILIIMLVLYLRFNTDVIIRTLFLRIQSLNVFLHPDKYYLTILNPNKEFCKLCFI